MTRAISVLTILLLPPLLGALMPSPVVAALVTAVVIYGFALVIYRARRVVEADRARGANRRERKARGAAARRRR